jgi:hypothetical protein
MNIRDEQQIPSFSAFLALIAKASGENVIKYGLDLISQTI